MRNHLQILGILNIVWGSFGMIAALIITIVFGGTLGIVGLVSHQEPDARIAIPIISFIGSIIVVILLITSLPSIIVGIGLIRLAPWSRIFGIVLSALHLFNIPFGTALGIYGLWVLLNQETVALYAPVHSPVRI